MIFCLDQIIVQEYLSKKMNSQITPQLQPDDDLVLYNDDGSIYINLPNILTVNNIITPNMPVIKMEGLCLDPVRITTVWDDEEYVYLDIIKPDGSLGQLIQTLDPRVHYYVWVIISKGFIDQVMKERIMSLLIGGA